MAAKTVDALTCFADLTEHMPQWISQITAVSAHAAKKHAEFRAEYCRLVAQGKSPRQKSPSISSIHSAQDDQQEPLAAPRSTPVSAPLGVSAFEISPLEAGSKYLLASARPKQRLGSMVQSGASGPQKFHNENMVVVYYDVYLQEQLESMVKALGGARNNLRKGKMSRSLTRGLRLPSFSKHFGHANDPHLAKKGEGPMTVTTDAIVASKSAAAPTELDGDAAFTQADRHLDSVQALCERAAHQFLRNGDCALELENAQKTLETVLVIVKETLEVMRAEDELTRALEDTETAQEEPNHVGGGAVDIVAKVGPSLNEKLDMSMAIEPTGTRVIEVDDDVDASDASSMVIDFTKVRAMARTTGVRA